MDVLNELLTRFFAFAGSMIWVAIICVAILYGSRWIRRWTKERVAEHGKSENVSILVDNIVRFAAYVLVGLFILSAISGDTGSVVTAVGLIAAAVSLSLQDILRNYVSGLYLLIEKPFEQGDSISVDGESGKVERVDIRTTVIRNSRKEEVFIPNLTVFSEVLKRNPGVTPNRYFIKSSGPAHESFDAIWNAALSLQSIEDMPPTVKITGTRDDTVDFEVKVWEKAGVNQSEAFIAAVKSSLPDAMVRLLKN